MAKIKIQMRIREHIASERAASKVSSKCIGLESPIGILGNHYRNDKE